MEKRHCRSTKMAVAGRSRTILSELRSFMKSKSHVGEPIQAYIIPSGDSHQGMWKGHATSTVCSSYRYDQAIGQGQPISKYPTNSKENEYIAPCHKRRQFISGFSGSAGTAVVTTDKALLWTDGRYFLQAEDELDSNWTLMKSGLPTSITMEQWLADNLEDGNRVGVDPFLISLNEWQRISAPLLQSQKHLIRIDTNLVDLVWKKYDIPIQKQSPLIALDETFTGKSWPSKVKELQTHLKCKSKCDAVVVTALDEIAWLFNLRGSDIDFNPVFYAYSIVTIEEAWLFIDSCRLTQKIHNHLETDKVKLSILPYEDMGIILRKLCEENIKCLVSGRSSSAVSSLVPVAKLLKKPSPIALMKAVKNKQEINGMKQCHIRDGLALCEFLSWLEKEVSKGNIDEIVAAEKLHSIRREQEHFMGLSFETISSVGKHACIIHYRPCKESASTLTDNEIFLCDSGGQYLDGTTDVTRTVHFGTPTQHEKECFTRVLKGHILLASTVFPNGTKGHSLDVLARKALWDCGLQYQHGTGHGVGSFLNVHEGPHGISMRCSEEPPLESGMVVTNEPGYYEDGNFGIRIENVMVVKDVKLKHNFKECGFLGFETLTMAPIQKKLIATDLLDAKEISWLNDYHEQCRAALTPYLLETGKDSVLKWLIKETSAFPI